MMKPIFLDNAATTPLDSRVWQVFSEISNDCFGNASSLHTYGTMAKAVLDHSRQRLAALLNAEPHEIIFTSGGTEANNLALKGVAFAHKSRGNHIIVSSTEHDCVLNACKWLETQGFFISYLPVDGAGIVDTQLLEKLINPKTILVSVMHVNNETGTIQPLDDLARICSNRGVYFHTDACQSFGKLPIDVSKSEITMLSANAHKIYGPKGVGCLYVKKGVNPIPLFHGGGQEAGLRSTTENIAGIAAFVKAAELCTEEMEKENRRLTGLRDHFIYEMKETFEGFYINGSTGHCLPNILNFGISGLEGETMRLLLLLDEEGIAVSAGSACSNNDTTKSASHVLRAMGKNQFEARGAVRVSFGRFNTGDEIDRFIAVLKEKIKQLNPIFS